MPAGAVTHDPVLEPLQNHDPVALRHLLEERIRSAGLAGFVCRDMPRMNAVVGDAWSCGGLQVYEEHLYTEAVQQLLRARLAALPALSSAWLVRFGLAATCLLTLGMGLQVPGWWPALRFAAGVASALRYWPSASS